MNVNVVPVLQGYLEVEVDWALLHQIHDQPLGLLQAAYSNFPKVMLRTKGLWLSHIIIVSPLGRSQNFFFGLSDIFFRASLSGLMPC